MSNPYDQIGAIVNQETRAWDTQDVSLLNLFHPDAGALGKGLAKLI